MANHAHFSLNISSMANRLLPYLDGTKNIADLIAQVSSDLNNAKYAFLSEGKVIDEITQTESHTIVQNSLQELSHLGLCE